MRALSDIASRRGTVSAMCALLVFWIGFAVGNSLITRAVLSEQSELYRASLTTLRD